MAMSTLLKNALLDHYIGGAPYAQPVPWISLHTADPGGTGANEVAGGAGPYARQSAAGKMAVAAGGSKANNADLVYPGMPAVGGAGITHAGLWDAAAAGNFLQGAPLAIAKTVNAGDTFVMTTPDLVATFTP